MLCRCRRCGLTDRGRAVHISAPYVAAEAGWSPTYGVTAVKPNGVQLQKIADMVAEGKVKVILDRTYLLEEAA